MKRFALFAALLLGIPTAGGLVIAQTAASPAKPVAAAAPAPAAHDHDHGAPPGPHAAQHEDMMCGKMMGAGGMGAMAGGGACPMMMGGGACPMMGAGTKIAVKNVDKGVTMTFHVR